MSTKKKSTTKQPTNQKLAKGNSASGYAYTLQTVPYEISAEEQRRAQLLMWRSTNKVRPRTWAIVAAVVLLSILGLIFIKNYSTIICWVALASVAIFLVLRLFVWEWYAKRKMAEFPAQEIKGIKLGIQPHGMVMQQQLNMTPQRGMQQVIAQPGVMNVAWKEVSEWYDNQEFLLMTFKVKDQDGSFFLPKRMDTKQFSFDTIRKHLNETVGAAKKF